VDDAARVQVAEGAEDAPHPHPHLRLRRRRKRGGAAQVPAAAKLLHQHDGAADAEVVDEADGAAVLDGAHDLNLVRRNRPLALARARHLLHRHRAVRRVRRQPHGRKRTPAELSNERVPVARGGGGGGRGSGLDGSCTAHGPCRVVFGFEKAPVSGLFIETKL
jgi:hypothetical protein